MDIIRKMLMQEDSGNTEEELSLKVKPRQTLTFWYVPTSTVLTDLFPLLNYYST